ncbi:hypothetical protein [Parapedobacter sp. 2B3]|uniref:hypothetical protein n=1 Tax=Parapedobacter sp. 2B3 TaxID=3342381 RepID=UPI0035B672EF
MNRCYNFLVAFFCLPVVGFAQHDGGTGALRMMKPERRTVIDSVLSDSKPKRGDRVFDTYPMPNGYRRDYAVAMPNAYRGDNCVPIPNAYQVGPGSFIVQTDRITGEHVVDSALMNQLNKLLDKQKEQSPKAGRP